MHHLVNIAPDWLKLVGVAVAIWVIGFWIAFLLGWVPRRTDREDREH